MTNENHPIEKKNLKSTWVVRGIFLPVFLIIFTLLLAGRIDYWQGWLYNILNILILLVTFIVLKDKKDLIEERLKPGMGVKKFDKIYFAVSSPAFFLMMIVSILDGGRFHWQPQIPVSIVFAGVFLYLIGHTFFLWAKHVNNFFATVVRIQTDRGQTVCKTGPYRFVRHPGYVGGILFGLASPLVLGSFWGVIPAVVSAFCLLIRTSLEDKVLKKELPGYLEYTKEVRYRLIPGIW